jgi:RNA polymerase sigma factor (sigma-70 family)
MSHIRSVVPQRGEPGGLYQCMKLAPELIQACIRSDPRAQSELYSRCYSLLMGIGMRYLNDEQEAMAMVNQGFLKVLNALETRNPNAPLEAWMRRIMINTVIDEFRRQRRHRETISYEDFDDTTDYVDFVDYNEADRRLDAAEIEAMVQRLPEVSRQVFNLYAIDGYRHQEIATWLGMSVGTSKWHVSYARKQLKNMIAQHLNQSKKHSL